jgi:hypothetical protein
MMSVWEYPKKKAQNPVFICLLIWKKSGTITTSIKAQLWLILGGQYQIRRMPDTVLFIMEIRHDEMVERHVAKVGFGIASSKEVA